MRQDPSIYPLGYQPSAQVGGRMRFSWTVFITTAYIVGIYAAFFLIAVPHMQQLYVSFKVALPWSAALVLGLGRWMDPWGAIGLIALPPALAVLTARMLPVPSVDDPMADRRAARWWARGIRIALLLLLVLMALAVFMPMVTLIQGISGAQR